MGLGDMSCLYFLTKIRVASRSEGYYMEAGDELEMAKIGCDDGVADFKGSDADEKIDGGNGDASGALLAVDLTGQERSGARVWNHCDIHHELLNELLAQGPPFEIGGAKNCMNDLSEGNSGDCHWLVRDGIR